MRVRRTPVCDEILLGDELVVMLDSTVVLLGPIASRILLAAGQGATLAEIEAVVYAEFGLPPDPEAVVSQVGELTAVGLLESL